MSDRLASANNLTRVFRRGNRAIEAVKPASWAIYPNDRIAIMGASGSGKSTLLHLMAGIEDASAGQISWPALGSRENLRPERISVAFQSPCLVPFLSVADNIAFPLYVLGKSKDAGALAVQALVNFGLEKLAQKLPDEISGGEAQRVGLARAMASRPRLLLADEPTGQLDQNTAQATIVALIEWAKATGSALVTATHDKKIAERFDRLWLMEHGCLITSVAGKP